MTDIPGLMQTQRGHVRVYFEHHRELPQNVRKEISAKRERHEGLVREALQAGSRARGLATIRMASLVHTYVRPGEDS